MHRIDGQETHSILLKNCGRSILNNILITLKASDAISGVYIDGPEIMDSSAKSYLISGNIGEKSIQFKIKRLLKHSSYTLTLLTATDTTIEPTIVCDETEANMVKAKEKFGIFEFASILISSLGVGLFSYYVLRIRRLITRREFFENCIEKRRESGENLKNYFDLRVILSEKIATSMAEIQAQSEHEVVQKALEDIRSLIEIQMKSFRQFSQTISVEGVCYSVAAQGEKTPSE